MRACYHIVADFSPSRDPSWPTREQRAQAVLREGVLRPPSDWAQPPAPGDSLTDPLAYYLLGLGHYLYFSYGVCSRRAVSPPALTITVDAKHLITNLGARVVPGQRLVPEDIARQLIGELRALYDDEIAAVWTCWVSDPAFWTRTAWPPVHDQIVPALTLGGDEALAFLNSHEDEDSLGDGRHRGMPRTMLNS